MKIVAFSDTHEQHRDIDIPGGDLLIFAGDSTTIGKLKAFESFAAWMGNLPHEHKILIGGNHDHCLADHRKQKAKEALKEADITYLEDSSTRINGANIWGAPWSNTVSEWCFNTDGTVYNPWKKIPDNTDILVTHGPAHGTGDYLHGYGHIGDKKLELELERIQPDLHIYGHVHEQYGEQKPGSWNVSLLDPDYNTTQQPAVIHYDP